MGFFKDFKEDLSQAVSEMTSTDIPVGDGDDGMMVNTLDEQPLDKPQNKAVSKDRKPDKRSEDKAVKTKSSSVAGQDATVKAAKAAESELAAAKEEEAAVDEAAADAAINEVVAAMAAREAQALAAEMSSDTDKENKNVKENAIITKSLTIKGDLITDGSLEVHGTIEGNVECKGTLIITGTIVGNAKAAVISVDGASVEGDLTSEGDIKVGERSVIVGNISATASTIAGAIKGNIDVHGPVVVDTTAIVAGDIKSKSMQINAGSVIEGHCSQCYADVTPSDFFKK